MANERYTRTNQKLHFAGLALQAWQRAEQSQALESRALVQAAREEALFHLYGAVLGLCHEVGGFYRVPDGDLPRVESLLDPARLQRFPSQELGELVELAGQPEAWLGRLLTAHQALYEPPQDRPEKGQRDELALIEAVQLGAAPPSVATREELDGWRQSLKSLAVRLREGMHEH